MLALTSKAIRVMVDLFFETKNATQKLVRKPSSSPARMWAHGCVSCETRGQIGRWCGGTGRVDVRVRAAAHAGRAGRGTAGAHLGLGWTGISPSNLHGGQLRRARARRAAAQLQASCPLSAGQEPCPPLEQRAPWPSEKSQRLRREGRVSSKSLSGAHAGMQRGQRAIGL